ncbi:hypothetical protein VHEMI09544 [[Torrubiella] hemipterigena]|uniref:Uncharacterized protein n=1 Tax=[Torrubiella] hemipterigena TaxID=1531966 RepID=A0A0A1TRP0_9HYPO|nr:hypothetical protein VHEMI09544 [[Torrubiella] hemipterigena]
MSSYDRYNYSPLSTTRVIADVLVVVTDAVAFGLAITALCRIRRRKDPARISFLWLKCTYALFAVAMTMHAAGLIMKTVATAGFGGSSYSGFVFDVKVLAQIATFFLDVVPSLIIVTLVLFDEGIRIIRLNSAAKVSRLPHRIAYAWCTVTILITLVTFSAWIFVIRSTRTVYSSGPDYDIIIDNRVPQVRGAITYLGIVDYALMAAAVLFVVIRSIYLRIRTRRIRHVRRLTNYYVVNACLMILTVLYTPLGGLIQSPFTNFSIISYTSGDSEGLSDLIHCVMVLWPYFIILTIFFAEGLKKRNTLATITEAPLMQEVESSAGLAPTSNSTVPDASETSAVATTSDPLASSSLPTPAAGSAAATSMPQYEANAFAWPVPIDEAPPEYSLPQRPLGHLEIPPRNPNIASHNTDENEDPALPDHNEAMGLNHQADGLRPRRNSLPEDWKHGMKKN